jgi:hypothetical protein
MVHMVCRQMELAAAVGVRSSVSAGCLPTVLLWRQHPKTEDGHMTLGNFISRTGKGLAAAAAIAGVVGLTAVPQPAHALGTGAAVGIGLGALAVGTAIGSGAAANPYGYYGYGYGPGYYGYGPAPGYYAPRSCWSPYYGRYVPC